jgi:short-subunit dehydrogenase
MIKRRSGHLVFISSLNGRVTTPATSIYSATKFGLRGFALGLRQDLRSDGVGVSVVMPGFISEAGMFADANVRLPPGVGTRTPTQVAAAVIRAVERNRAEVDVAPLGLRVGATIAGVAPELAATVNRWAGAERVASELAKGHRSKRD